MDILQLDLFMPRRAKGRQIKYFRDLFVEFYRHAKFVLVIINTQKNKRKIESSSLNAPRFKMFFVNNNFWAQQKKYFLQTGSIFSHWNHGHSFWAHINFLISDCSWNNVYLLDTATVWENSVIAKLKFAIMDSLTFEGLISGWGNLVHLFLFIA